MVINGVEIQDLDIFDADVAEKYEAALKEVSKNSHANSNMTGSEVIRKQCDVIFKCFNSLLGEGTDKKIFGDKVNIITCLKAFEELIDQTNEQASELKKMQAKYSKDRIKRSKK